MTWHTDQSLLSAYQAGTLRPAQAASVEAHLTACGPCRSSLATMADPGRLGTNWAAIEDRLDDRPPPLSERFLLRMGVGEHHARLIALTPALRAPTVACVVALFAAGVVTAQSAGGMRGGSFFAFLVAAPLLPLAGVAAAFGISDPVEELTTAAPTPAFELLLARALAIVTVTTAVSLAAAFALPDGGLAAVTWLLPALGLSAASLALSTWVPASWASAGLGGAWVTAAVVSWRVNRFDTDVVGRFAALGPTGQLLFALVGVAGALVLVLRRETLDYRRIP